MTRASVLIALTLGLVAIGVLATTRWPADSYRDGDFFAFWAGSRAIVEGGDPYDLGWWTAIHDREGSRELVQLWPPQGPRWPSAYPLWTDVAFVPFALLPFAWAAATWLVTQVAIVVGVTIAVGRRVIGPGAGRAWALAIVVLVGSQPFWLLVVGGNMTGWLFALYWGAVALLLADRPRGAGALLALVILKPQAFLVGAPLVAITSRHRVRVVVSAAAVVLAIVGITLMVRPDWMRGWWSTLAIVQTVPHSNATLWTIDRLVGGAPVSAPIAVATLLTAALVWVRTIRPPWLLMTCAATAVSVAVAPYGWSYDQLLLLPIALPVIAAGYGRPLTRAAMLVAVVVVFDALPWVLYALAFQRGGEAQSVLTPVLAFGLVVLSDRLRRPLRASPHR